MFVPATHYGDAPFGTWTFRLLTVTNGWFNSAHDDLDVGFVVVNKNSGATIEATVGGFGYTFNDPTRDQLYTLLGYPADGAWAGGNYQMVSHSKYGGTVNLSTGPDTTKLGGDWTVGGASGSPVVKKFSGTAASFTNKLTHVVHGVPAIGGDVFYAAYFGDGAFNAYNTVASA